MNSKQYVIFRLCLLFLSMVRCLYADGGGDTQLDYRIRLVDNQFIVQPPSDESAQSYPEDEDHTHQEELAMIDPEKQEYHDQPNNIPIDFESVHSHMQPTIQQLVMGAVQVVIGSALCVGGILVVLDRIVERAVINKVLARYDKSMTTITVSDAQLMRMAYRLDDTGLQQQIHAMIRKYGERVFLTKKRAWVIPALAELYFDTEPTASRVTEFIALIG